MASYLTLYDFANRLPNFDSLLFPVIFLVTGLFMWYINKRHASSASPATQKNDLRIRRFFGQLYTVMALLISLWLVFSSLHHYLQVKQIYYSDKLLTTEGSVDYFLSSDYSPSHEDEMLINNVRFSISPADNKRYGYNQTAANGSPLKENMLLRISYYNDGDKNVILKLEKAY